MTFTPAPSGGQGPLSFSGAHTQPSFDLLDLLPMGTPQDRLRLLRRRSLDLHSLCVPFEEVRQASLARQEAANAHRRLVEHPHQHGFGLPDDNATVVQALKTLERAEAELTRVQQRQSDRAQSWQASGRVVSEIESYLRHSIPRGCSLEPAVVEPPPKLLKGETLLDALDRVRRRGREIKASLHTVRSSPWPSAHVKRRVREIVERTAREPDLTNLIEHDAAEISWPLTRYQAEVIGGEARALAFHQSVDVLGVLTWLFRDQLTKKLFELADQSGDEAAAMSTEQRQTAEAQLLGDSLAIERSESEIVWLLMAQGVNNVEHRSDCAPLAILGVTLVTVPNGRLPGTSPEHAYDILRPGGR